MNLKDGTLLDTVPLHILETSNFDIILGRDFMKLNKVDILHSSGNILIKNNSISHDQNVIFSIDESENKDYKTEVNKLLLIYSSSIDKYQPITGEKFKIPLINEQIVSSKPYPVPYHLYEKLKLHINELLERLIIRHSNLKYLTSCYAKLKNMYSIGHINDLRT